MAVASKHAAPQLRKAAKTKGTRKARRKCPEPTAPHFAESWREDLEAAGMPADVIHMVAELVDRFGLTRDQVFIEQVWDQFGIVLDSFGIMLESCWCNAGIVWNSFWDHVRIVLESFWDQC